MKKFLLTTLIMIAGMFTLPAGAQTGTVAVHIDEDFVVGGKTLPSGTYQVYQGSPQTGQTLILRGEEASIFLIPTTHDGAPPKNTGVKLTRAGDVYYLSAVATNLGVYTFRAPRVLTRTARVKDKGLEPPSGTN